MVLIARVTYIDIICSFGFCSTERYLAVNRDKLRFTGIGTAGILYDHVLKLLRRISGIAAYSSFRGTRIRRIRTHCDRYRRCSSFYLVNTETYR